MAVAFTVASWNVEHFGKGSKPGQPSNPARLQRVCDTLKQLDPDVFAIYEVESGVMFDAFTAAFPVHHFSITEGAGTQQILVAAEKNVHQPGVTIANVEIPTMNLRPAVV